MKNISILKVSSLLIIFQCLSCEPNQDLILNGNCIPSNLKKGLIAFYPFSYGSLADRSGNNHTLINKSTASATLDRGGSKNCAFIFNNIIETTEFLTTTKTTFLNGLRQFTISVWYKPLDTSHFRGLLGYEVLVGRGQVLKCPDRVGIWSLGLFDGRRAVFGYNNSVWANPISKLLSGSDEPIIQTNSWHHVVAVYNNGRYKLYFNGVLNDYSSGPAGCGNQKLPLDVGDLFIGKYYTGIIDDILIYNRELSQSEVSQLFYMSPCCN